ncbi:MAG: LacI family transcriptional regulator [Propionibacteriaceae bacterium]|jgi:LacI family transcriptional regulator|nr:LacI family transcriptional regulator [Propionibacteriaceae bacterium]
MTDPRVTLHDVARAADVSLGSVSRALHGSGASPRMVERVQAAAKRLGYRPDAAARTLRTGRTLHLGFAVADIGNPVYVEMMRAIHEVVSPDGYHVVVMSSGNSAASARQLVESLSFGLVDGLIVSPLWTDAALIGDLARLDFPVVLLGPAPADSPVDSVGTDSAAGIRLAVEHLQATGRRRLVFLNGPAPTTAGSARQRGLAQAVADPALGVELVGSAMADDFTVAAGTTAVQDLLDRPRGTFDAVVAANDLLAIGAVTAARRRGWTVPADLAVTGMDGTEFAHIFSPSLTTVSLGARERGQRAAELMLERLTGGRTEPRRVEVPPRLVLGESTATGREA